MLQCDRSLTAENNQLKGGASLYADINCYSKRFVELIDGNRKRAQNRTERLQMGKVSKKRSTENTIQYFLGGKRLNSSSHLSRVSLGKYLINPSDLSNINDNSFPVLQHSSSERALFNCLKENSLNKVTAEVPPLSIGKISSMNRAAYRQNNPSFTNRPANSLLRDMRVKGGGSKILLSELRESNEDSLIFNSPSRRVRRRNASVTPKLFMKKIGSKIGQKPVMKEQNNSAINAPFRQMTLLENLLRPRLRQPAYQNNQHIHFNASRTKKNYHTAVNSQVSLSFKNDGEYKNLYLNHNPAPNFCDYSLNLQRQIYRKAANRPELVRFQNGYHKLFGEANLTNSEKELEYKHVEDSEHKLTSQQFLNWEIKQQEKKQLKAFMLKSNVHQKKKFLNESNLPTASQGEIHNQSLQDNEAPKSYSRWMEIIDSLLAADSLATVSSFGYYNTDANATEEVFGSQSLKSIMAFMMHRVLSDLLVGKKFAFMFRKH